MGESRDTLKKVLGFFQGWLLENFNLYIQLYIS